MRYSPEEIFKKFINSVLSDASLDFFVKRAAVFLSMMMPVSSLFIFRSVEGSITKLAECNKTPAININDHFAISPESMTRLRTEKHFFSEGACNLKIFTGHETCAYADVHRSVYKTDTSAVYIPLKFNMLRETSVTMVVISMGVDNYTQEHLEICSCIQPVFIDNFLNILSENSSDRAFDLPSPKSKQEPNSKRNKDNAEPFQTFNEVTVNYIIKALNRTNGKISGQDGAAELRKLPGPGRKPYLWRLLPVRRQRAHSEHSRFGQYVERARDLRLRRAGAAHLGSGRRNEIYLHLRHGRGSQQQDRRQHDI